MKTFNFEYAVKPYEAAREDRDYKRKDVNSYEYTIKMDAERSFIFLKPITDQERWCKNLYKYITEKILLETTVEYYQGMFEVSSYFVFFYFEDSATAKYKKIIEKMSEDEDIPSEESEETERQESDLSQFIDEEIYKKCSTVITNVLQEKYIPLVENNFLLYNRYNKVFVKMMDGRGIHLDQEVSGSYMNTTLSWLSRSMENVDDVYKIFAMIISCPTNMPFLMLVHYFDTIKSGKKIKSVDDDVYRELISLEHEFLRVESDKHKPTLLSKRSLLIGAATLGVVLAIVFYQLSKRDK